MVCDGLTVRFLVRFLAGRVRSITHVNTRYSWCPTRGHTRRDTGDELLIASKARTSSCCRRRVGCVLQPVEVLEGLAQAVVFHPIDEGGERTHGDTRHTVLRTCEGEGTVGGGSKVSM
jgi:hypothetical protein